MLLTENKPNKYYVFFLFALDKHMHLTIISRNFSKAPVIVVQKHYFANFEGRGKKLIFKGGKTLILKGGKKTNFEA